MTDHIPKYTITVIIKILKKMMMMMMITNESLFVHLRVWYAGRCVGVFGTVTKGLISTETRCKYKGPLRREERR